MADIINSKNKNEMLASFINRNYNAPGIGAVQVHPMNREPLTNLLSLILQNSNEIEMKDCFIHSIDSGIVISLSIGMGDDETDRLSVSVGEHNSEQYLRKLFVFLNGKIDFVWTIYHEEGLKTKDINLDDEVTEILTYSKSIQASSDDEKSNNKNGIKK